MGRANGSGITGVSQLLIIHHYLNELQTLRRVSGTTRESVVSEAFKTLLKDWGTSRDLIFIPPGRRTPSRVARAAPLLGGEGRGGRSRKGDREKIS